MLQCRSLVQEFQVSFPEAENLTAMGFSQRLCCFLVRKRSDHRPMEPFTSLINTLGLGTHEGLVYLSMGQLQATIAPMPMSSAPTAGW